MLFKGATINLRKMSQQDKVDYQRWNNDMELAPMVNPFIDLQSAEEIDEYFQNIHDKSRKNYIIEHIVDEKAIGYLGLFNINHYHKNTECYIAVCEKSYHGQGVGYEAMQLLMEYVFREMNMHRLALRVFAENERAIRLYEKLGFKKEGYFRDTRFHNGGWQSSYIMAILQHEYQSDRTSSKN
ncbi:GNAT family N-acetyltransferase [Alkalihalobacillus sp. AL-G]|uniref:GNAT family N-acetyltransferase n=1 Tax=Alkalihalobacillus sp. AL-G TaxID=2926399 RepID=UPI00272D3E29|nr:GNAT family protein [Alkalihalobacillus sp. AL-G]WLD94751.1 GNAT family N-acetyltransferase [Alkalihalobacillus sp. AL-G]